MNEKGIEEYEMAGEHYHFTNAELQVLENIQVPFAVYHLQSSHMRIVLVSQGVCGLFDIERSKLLQYLDNPDGKYIHPFDRAEILRLRQAAIRREEKEFRLTYRLQLPGMPDYLWIRVSCAMKRQKDGSFLLYLSYFDATDEQERRLQDQKKHRRQEVLLEKILSTTQTALFWKDAQRRFLGANKAFLDYYGFSSEQEILGRTDEEMGWHTEPDPYKNDECRIIKNGESTYRVHGKCISHGENRDIVASKSPMYENGKIIGLVGSFEDVTDDYRQRREIEKLNQMLLKALDKAEAASRAKSDFLSNISHDMRTPLNGILGFTDLAMQAEDIVTCQQYLGKIKSAGCFLRDLINDTLELSRIENGKKILHPESVDSKDILDSVINSVKGTADAKHIDFQVHTEKADLGYIRIDRINVEKIFLNLLSNAVKFTAPSGKVEFIIEGLTVPDMAGNYRFIVRDNGIGMSEAFIPKMFNAFEQEHPSDAKDIVGTGLGLAIVQQLVALMKGRIEVKSKKGEGTEFTVYLPIERVSESHVMKEKNQSMAQDNLAGKRVLICEDHPLNQEISRAILERQGIEVVCAENGKIGVDIFASSKPEEYQAILMDIRMPVLNGLLAAEAIRQLPRDDAKTVPIIALSANAFDEDIQKSKKAGMDYHLTKPIEPDELYRVLGKLMK